MKTEYSFDNETWYDAPEGKAFVPGVGEIYLRMTNETTASQPKDLSAGVQQAMYHAAHRGESVERMHAAVMAVIASQPKSIGDDAQFRFFQDSDIVNCLRSLATDPVCGADVPVGKALLAEAAKRLDMCAPAAQASATIQAAPEGFAAKVRAIAEKWNSTAIKEGFAGNEVAYELLAALGDFDDAATIQEPVMVAEPVDDGLPPEVQKLFDQLRPEIDYWCTHRRESNLAALDAIEFRFKVSQARTVRLERAAKVAVSTTHAAPMVADPAGVAGDDAAKAMHWFSCLEECAKLLGLPDDEPIPSGVVKAVRTLAATVKAVPSEALELAGMVVKATFGDHKILVPRVDLSGKGIGTLVYFAAPLADKTGGGK